MRLAASLIMVLIVSLMGGCPTEDLQVQTQKFLHEYAATYQRLYYAASLAEWESNTRIVEGDQTNASRTREAQEALAAFTGSIENIETCQRLLSRQDQLAPLQVEQLEVILYLAADKPQTVPHIVRERIAVETEQVEKLYGFHYRLGQEEVTTNQIDEVLRSERSLSRRRQAWEASKEVGPVLRPGLKKLQQLRNATVRALGYDNFFSYQVSEYGMDTSEMMELMKQINAGIRPLYRELHTYVRYELARRYKQPVPDLIPAHWLPNRWGQEWQPIVTVQGFDLDAALSDKSAEWIVRQAERFYASLGFSPLPESFYERSSLYPLPANAVYKKNNHASAWHLDLRDDIRSLMSVEPNSYWYETAHHELGHIYYYISYSSPEVPILLRSGANRAFHEGIGSLMGLAATQPRFLSAVGLAPEQYRPEPIQTLLKEALNYVVFIPWSAGVMTEFEYALYARQLPPDQWNGRWWELKARYQGIVPPGHRGENFCDPATKTHINDDAAQYYDYALSYLLLFQLHDHIARQILKEDPHDTNYFDLKQVGEFLGQIMRPGQTVDWRRLLEDTMGEQLSARAMLEYFQPLRNWLQQQNRGRKHTLPE